MCKIFISYNREDEQLVDHIARLLEVQFGRNNIFYDKWSIKPGENIIGKMNDGLEKFETFFFFISPKSMTSEMVSLEWQNALFLATKKHLKFVPVRIADCNPPAILTASEYIDLYGEGMDNAIEKMKKVVKSEDFYQPLKNVQNLHAKVTEISEKLYKVQIYATYYAEPSTTFAIACDDIDNELSLVLTGVFTCGHITLHDQNGNAFKASTLTPLDKTVRPGFPCIFEVKAIKPVNNFFVLYFTDSQKGELSIIPID